MKEEEAIFIDIDKEVAFHGQPCGVIVAKTMALANFAATQVDIVYEKIPVQRPIIPSIQEWLKMKKPQENIVESEKIIMTPNHDQGFIALGGEKKIEGM